MDVHARYPAMNESKCNLKDSEATAISTTWIACFGCHLAFKLSSAGADCVFRHCAFVFIGTLKSFREREPTAEACEAPGTS